MTNISIGKILLALIVSAILVASTGSGVSAQTPDSSDTVRIVVHLIEASNGAPGVDPEIKDILKDFRDEFRYSTYKLISKVPKTINKGGSQKVALPDSRELQLFSKGYENGRVKLRVKIVEKPKEKAAREMLNTEFRIVRGGTIIIGPYNYKKGKLLLAISADK
jgi:hypothetical protein